MKLQNGREVPDELLDNVIETTVVQYAGMGFDESLSDSIDITIESLQEDPGWLPDDNNLIYEEACEVLDIVREPLKQFASGLADAYNKLKDKYIETKSWELYK